MSEAGEHFGQRAEELFKSCSFEIFLPVQDSVGKSQSSGSSHGGDEDLQHLQSAPQRESLFFDELCTCVVKIELPHVDARSLAFLDSPDLEIALNVHRVPELHTGDQKYPKRNDTNPVDAGKSSSFDPELPGNGGNTPGYPYTPAPQPEVHSIEERTFSRSLGVALDVDLGAVRRGNAQKFETTSFMLWQFNDVRVPHISDSNGPRTLALVPVITFKTSSGTTTSADTRPPAQHKRSMDEYMGGNRIRKVPRVHTSSTSTPQLSQPQQPMHDFLHLKRSICHLVLFNPVMTLGRVKVLPGCSGTPQAIAIDLACDIPSGSNTVTLSRLWVETCHSKWQTQGSPAEYQEMHQHDTNTVVLTASDSTKDTRENTFWSDRSTLAKNNRKNWDQYLENPVLHIEGQIIKKRVSDPLPGMLGPSVTTSHYRAQWNLPEWPSGGDDSGPSNSGLSHWSGSGQGQQNYPPTQAKIGITIDPRATAVHQKHLTSYAGVVDPDAAGRFTPTSQSEALAGRTQGRPKSISRSVSAFNVPASRESALELPKALVRPTPPQRTVSASVSSYNNTTMTVKPPIVPDASHTEASASPVPLESTAQAMEHAQATSSGERNVILSARLVSDGLLSNNPFIPMEQEESCSLEVQNTLARFRMDGPSPSQNAHHQLPTTDPATLRARLSSIKAFDTFFLELWLQNVGFNPVEAAIHLRSPKSPSGQCIAAILEPVLHASLLPGGSQLMRARCVSVRPGRFIFENVLLESRGISKRLYFSPPLALTLVE